jgi:phosphatidylinositol-3-phosphatase
MKHGFLTALAASSVLSFACASADATTLRANGAHRANVPHFNHVFLVIGENTSLREITARRTPYLAGTLIPAGASLTEYQAVHGGSLSDYMALTSGEYTTCEINDSLPYFINSGKPKCIDRGASIFSLLDAAGDTWTVWNESMPNPCGFIDVGEDWSYNVYSTHHNPGVYYESVEGARYAENFDRAPNAECLQRDLPMGSTAPNDTTAFDAAVATGDVPQFNFIVPNDCENGHDACGVTDKPRQFDDFLAREVPKIFASPAFGSDGLLIVTFDEWGDATPSDKRVAFVAVGPMVKPGIVSSTPYDHYSLLRTLQDGYGLRPYLHNAAKTNSISGIWINGR